MYHIIQTGRTLAVALVLAAGMFTEAGAQDIQVDARFDSTVIMIGDQIKLRIELERQKNISVQFPAWADTLTRNIEIIEVHPVDSAQASGGMVRMTQDILVTSFDSGRHVLPPLRFPFAAGGKADTIATRPAYLDVRVMPMDTTQNIADIKPVYRVPIGWADVWPWLAAFGLLRLAVILIGFGIYAFSRWRDNKPVFSTPKPAEPPHIIALRDLDRLRTEKLWQNNRTKEYYTRLSDVVRTYIEGRFGVLAMEMTSDEILQGLRVTGFEDNNLIARLLNLFTLSDLVKFAKADPLADENETSMLDSYLFVNNTKVEIPIEVIDSDSSTKEESDLETVAPADNSSGKDQRFYLNLLKRISSAKKWKHSFCFSLISLAILQIVILPGNIGLGKPEGWGIYFFFGMLLLIWILNIWTYSKFFYSVRLYKDIFKLSFLYWFSFFTLVLVEIVVLDILQGPSYNVLFYILIFLLFQSVGILFTLFLSMIMYYVKGGKMIEYKK